MRVQNGDVSLNVLVDGDADSPPLLLMHGILGSSATWEWMVPRVVDRFRVLRLDFRGHGDSDRAPDRYQFAEYVGDAVAVCEQLAQAPVAVVGHSLGGATAAALAQTRPDLVRAALLEDAPFAGPEAEAIAGDDNSLYDAFAMMRQTIPQAQAAGLTAEMLAPMIAAGPYAGGGTMGDLLLDDALLTMARATTQVDASVLDPVLHREIVPVHDPSRPIDVPIVVVAADPAMPDAVTTPDDLERLVASGTQVTTHTLAGANHLIHDTVGRREPFWSIVDEFLAPLA